MKSRSNILCMILILGLSLPFFAPAQSGGDFTITKSVVGSGGGTSSGGDFSITTSNGQPAAGARMTNPPFTVATGLFPLIVAPTAAGAMIRGRVLVGKDRPVKNAVITLLGGILTTPCVAQTNQFGYFTFNDIETGQFYIISVRHKRYGFGQDTRSLTLLEDVDDIIFRADWEN